MDFSKLVFPKIYPVYIGSNSVSSAGILIPISQNSWRASTILNTSATPLIVCIDKSENVLNFYGSVSNINSLSISELIIE